MTVPEIRWEENQTPHSARWRSESGAAPPKRVVVADDTLTADMAYRQACEGVGLLWRGDFQNARQLLNVLHSRGAFSPLPCCCAIPLVLNSIHSTRLLLAVACRQILIASWRE